MKKKIIISILSLVVLIGLVFTGLYFKKINEVVTTLTMDINPSLKLSLNYKNEVIKVEGLNEDGKNLLKDNNLKGTKLESAIENITDLVITNGYITEEDNHILINVSGKDIKNEVVTIINNEFKEKNTECNVIMQEVNDTSKENAEKYGISESKASYIENIIKENENLTFEDLKDKSINEINQFIKDKEEVKQEEMVEPVVPETPKEETPEQKPEQNQEQTKPTTPAPQPQKPVQKPVATPPASTDRTGAWCEFYKTIPPEGGVEYETPGYINVLQTYVNAAKNYMPEDASWSYYFSSISDYTTASYCSAGIVEVENYDKTKTYTAYIDSVTLELLELKVKELEKPAVDEAGARTIVTKWLLDNYGVDINECEHQNFYYAIDGSTKIPEWQFSCKNDETLTYYAVVVNGRTGALSSDRTWGE